MFVGNRKGGAMLDTFKARRRLAIGLAVGVVVAGGLGIGAKAGILSRADTDGNQSSHAAAAAIGDPSTGQDVVAVNETDSSFDPESESYQASATALRVGDTKVGEAPAGQSDPLGQALNGQPTEQLIDAGCDNYTLPQAPLCASVLNTQVANGGSSGATAVMWLAQVRAGGTFVYVLPSGAGSEPCGGQSIGALVYTIDATMGTDDGVDVSQDGANICNQ